MKDYAIPTTSDDSNIEENTHFDTMMGVISLVLFICATSLMWLNV